MGRWRAAPEGQRRRGRAGGARPKGSRSFPPPRYRYISKETSTRFYIAAWVVWIIAVVAFAIARQHVASSNPFLPTDPNLGGLASIVEILAFVMAILWIGALVRLARQH